MQPSPTTAAVIGSGFGGLALAIRLQAAGVHTTLFEQRDKPGGRAYVYQDQGFTFDAGPTVITAPGCLEELFALAGERMADHVDLLPVFPFYRLFWEDGDVFDYSNDAEALMRQIAARNPADVEGYRRFLAYAEQVFDQGYTKLAHVPFLDLWSMVRAAPQLVRLEAYRTVYDMVAKYIQDDHLRQTFSFHSLLVGGNPVRHLVDLHPHPRARAHVGGHLSAWRHRRPGAPARGALRAARRHGAPEHAGGPDPHRRQGRHGRAYSGWRGPAVRRRRQQRRCRAHLQSTCSGTSRVASRQRPRSRRCATACRSS